MSDDGRIALVIDITTRQPYMADNPATPRPEPPGPEATDVRRVSVIREGFERCYHRQMQIDDKQRTVKCGDCGIWLDPVWCLRELFYFYETRLDERISYIKQAEDREQAKREKAAQRKAQPRRALTRTRDQELARAAYNEYQAKLLSIRANRQRTNVAKIEQRLAALPGAEGDSEK